MLTSCVIVPIAAGLFYHPPTIAMRLPPEIAALAMAMSSVSVICSSLWLKRYQKPLWASSPTAPSASAAVAQPQQPEEIELHSKRSRSSDLSFVCLSSLCVRCPTEFGQPSSSASDESDACDMRNCTSCGCLVPRPGQPTGQCTCPAQSTCRLRTKTATAASQLST
jgi:hypothetical protein